MKITIKNLDSIQFSARPGEWKKVNVRGISTCSCSSKDGRRTWTNIVFDTSIGTISGYETAIKRAKINLEDLEYDNTIWLKVVQKGKWLNFTEASLVAPNVQPCPEITNTRPSAKMDDKELDSMLDEVAPAGWMK